MTLDEIPSYLSPAILSRAVTFILIAYLIHVGVWGMASPAGISKAFGLTKSVEEENGALPWIYITAARELDLQPLCPCSSIWGSGVQWAC
jgi:hypothetical protein